MKFTAQYPQMTVHRADCADLTKSRNIADQRVTDEAESVKAFIASELEEDLGEMGFTAADFTVLPCCYNKAPAKAPVAKVAKPKPVRPSCDLCGDYTASKTGRCSLCREAIQYLYNGDEAAYKATLR